MLHFVSNTAVPVALEWATGGGIHSHKFKYDRTLVVEFSNESKNVFSSKGNFINLKLLFIFYRTNKINI